MKQTLMFILSLLFLPVAFGQSIDPNDQLREMRGIWVSSVANIDWPSAPGLTDEALKREADVILDRTQQMGLNTIFLQVRPSSDAFYLSSKEPLSSYLVGKDNGRSLSFDPLVYWIDGAHRRGMELHAWINPFRVSPKIDFTCGENHLSKTHADWTIRYGGKVYLNPGLPHARQYVCDVVMDIVHRYDIDGIHFDDYFYPYPVKGEVFDDRESFLNYNPFGLSLANWRRNNVTDVIRSVADSIYACKPWVQFGISPFGVWRNKRDDATGSDTKAGITNYDILYADVLDWIRNGYVDYVIPQIYWERGNRWCDFDVLEQWWGNQSTSSTRVFVGHAVFKINDANQSVGWNSETEMPKQLKIVRLNKRLDGSVFFSYRQFNRDILGFEQYLTDDFYAHKALQVQVEKSSASDIGITHLERDGERLHWRVEGDTSKVRFYIVYRSLWNESDIIGFNETIHRIVDKPYIYIPVHKGRRQRYVYRVAAVDKYRRIHEMSRKITIRE